MDVFASFARNKGDFDSILTTFPTKTVEADHSKMTKAHDEQILTQQKGNAWSTTVNSMRTMGDLRTVISTLVAGANADDAGDKMSAQCHVMMTAMWGIRLVALQIRYDYIYDTVQFLAMSLVALSSYILIFRMDTRVL